MLSQKNIEEILKKCYPGMSETVLNALEATERAEMVFEDLTAVKFDLKMG
jgi:hypothetical protein